MAVIKVLSINLLCIVVEAAKAVPRATKDPDKPGNQRAATEAAKAVLRATEDPDKPGNQRAATEATKACL